MSEKHTPGPWAIDPGDSGDSSVGIGPTPATIWAPAPNGDVVEIARLSEPGYSVEPVDEHDEGIRYLGSIDANGRLIAASPEMLEALQIALQCCEFAEGKRRRGWDQQFVADTIRAAIAKATASS